MGNTSTIKFITFLFAFLLCSCHSQKRSNNECYHIFKKDTIKDLTFLHGEKKNDTLLFVIQERKNNKNIDTKCIFFSEKMKKIESINSGNEMIYFEFKRKIIGKNIQLNVGSFAPGTKNIVNSYYSLPLLIE